jgi:hypothetical protein
MAGKQVKFYWAAWDADGHFGTLWIQTDDNITTQFSLADPTEFAAMVDLLRNEKPLSWDKDKKLLSTYNEEPGEGES